MRGSVKSIYLPLHDRGNQGHVHMWQDYMIHKLYAVALALEEI